MGKWGQPLTFDNHVKCQGLTPVTYKKGFLRQLTERALDLGIQVCLENLSEKAGDLAGVLKEVPRLGITLDVGHGQLLTDENTSFGFIERFPDRIKHMHLHDNHGGDSPNDDLHLPVGSGSIAFEPIFRELAAAGWGGTVTLELRPHEIKKCLPRAKKLLDILHSNRGVSS